MSRKVTIAVLGAGNRGHAYGWFVSQHLAKAGVVDVAEPNPVRRQK